MQIEHSQSDLSFIHLLEIFTVLKHVLVINHGQHASTTKCDHSCIGSHTTHSQERVTIVPITILRLDGDVNPVDEVGAGSNCYLRAMEPTLNGYFDLQNHLNCVC